MDEILNKIIGKAGWQNNIVTKTTYHKLTTSAVSFQYYISNSIFNDNTLALDAIFFVDTAPVIYIKTLDSYNETEVINLQNRFWNECRAPLLLIISSTVIKIIDNYSRPVSNVHEMSAIELQTFSTTETDLEKLAALLRYSKLDGEKVFGYTLKLKTRQRVDRELIEQLRETRKQLRKKYGLNLGIVHDLLGRSLFTLYLEQREILTKSDILKITEVSDNFFDLLQNHPNGTYTLFRFLKDKFNGDLFPITEEEVDCVAENPEILKLIYNCYTGHANIKTGQQAFPFRLFNFKYIPIELISAIYEEFMSDEFDDSDKTDDEKKNLGAYYTPQKLVEFTYNEVLPMPSVGDSEYNIKILDPACGSGIFLVEGFKRLIERWKFAHKKNEIGKEILQELLLNNIYGIEINTEAIKITAFSLYLTYLQYMNPREILSQVQFDPLIFWTDADIRNSKHNKSGGNLLQANTFIRENPGFKDAPIKDVITFFDNDFKILIGNPPWKRSKLDVSIKNWAISSKWDLDDDIIKGFLAYSSSIAPNAKVALISSAKVLFNTDETDENFRFKFFSKNHVSAIVNFSCVRNVLFEKAKQAAALIIYNHRNGKTPTEAENILYCVPKTSNPIKNRNVITIDASEIKYIPLSDVLNRNSKIFKISMYGNVRDLKFINKLNKLKSINDITKTQGMGLIVDKEAAHRGNTHLAEYAFIDAHKIIPYYTKKPVGKLKDHKSFPFFRTDNRDIYTAPLILFKEGTKNGKICCSYVDYNVAYTSASKGIKFPGRSEAFHKAMTACLNSSLATYYFIQTSSSIGVDRNRIQRNEVSLFPAIPEVLEHDSINELAKLVDSIISVHRDFLSQDSHNRKMNTITKQIDSIIYRSLNISKVEQILIQNTINYSNVLRSNYAGVGAEKPVNVNSDLHDYALTFLEVINKQLKNSKIRMVCEVYPSGNNKDELMCILFKFEKNSTDNSVFIQYQDVDISAILSDINKSLSESVLGKSIYYRKILKYNVRNAFYLIKPNERRFWTTAIALSDADDLLVEILNLQYT